MQIGRHGPAKGKDFYENMYNTEQEYHHDYHDSIYLAVWAQVYRFLRRIPDVRILEVGCGSGQFASFLNAMGIQSYFKGFDLSDQAIQIARQRVGFDFSQGDACDSKNYTGDYNTIVTLETMEHIPDEFAALNNMPAGKYIVMSLPDFEYESHYRWFTCTRQIEKRYYRHIDIQEIVKIDHWYVVFGRTGSFAPNWVQRLFRTRRQAGADLIWRYWIRPTISWIAKPAIRAIFSR